MEIRSQIQERKAGGNIWLQIPGSANLQSVVDLPGCPVLLRCSLERSMDWQRRAASSVQQAVRAARLAPEFVAALYALDAEVTSSDLDSSINLAEAVETKADVLKGEWVLEIPVGIENVCTGFEVVSRTPGDKPVVAAACAVENQGGSANKVGLAVTGVWRGGAVRIDTTLLKGKVLDETVILDFLNSITLEKNLVDDHRGSKEYRLAMLKVVIRRALQTCVLGGEQ